MKCIAYGSFDKILNVPLHLSAEHSILVKCRLIEKSLFDTGIMGFCGIVVMLCIHNPIYLHLSRGQGGLVGEYLLCYVQIWSLCHSKSPAKPIPLAWKDANLC